MQQENDLLVVFDGTALLFQSYFGMGKISAPDGREVGALFGAGQRLTQWMERLRPRYAAVVFDAGKETFRTTMDPRYKANRGEPPADMVHQFDWEKEMIASLGFACFCVPNYEADDLMATLARLARNTSMSTQLVGIDKDLCQLVSDQPPAVFLYDPRDATYLNEAGVKNRLGVLPSQVVDFFALLGDSSDNVPGVKGVGAKTAQAILEAFGDLDAVYRDVSAVGKLTIRRSKSLVQTLEQGKEQAYLSRQLVTLIDDVELGISSAVLRDVTRWMGPTSDAEAVFDQLGFHRPLASLHKLAQHLGPNNTLRAPQIS